MGLLEECIEAIDDNIEKSKDVESWLTDVIKDVEYHQKAVRVSKTAAAAGGVVGTILLFTPLAPVGIAAVVASGVTGAGASIGDVVVTSGKAKEIKKKVEKLKSCEEKLQNLQKQLQVATRHMSEEYNLSEEEAAMAVLKGVTSISPGVISAGGQVLSVSGRLAMSTVVTGGKLATDVSRMSFASVSTAASFSEIVLGGGEAALGAGEVALGGGEVAAGVTRATAGVALAGIGAAIGVADAIWTWSRENSTLGMAKDLAKKLEDVIEGLKKAKKIYDLYKMINLYSTSVVVGDDIEAMFSKLGMGGKGKGGGPRPNYRAPGHNARAGGQGGRGGGRQGGRGGQQGAGQGGRGGGGPPRRLWDEVYFFEEEDQMYQLIMQWLQNMLQQLFNGGQLQFGADGLANQFGATQIQGQNVHVTPRGEGHRATHCEQQLIQQLNQAMNQAAGGLGTSLIYTEHFTCHSRQSRCRRCDCYRQVRAFAQNNPQTLVFLLYHQPYPHPGTGQTWEDIALQNENYLVLNEPGIDLPLNLAFVQVDYVIEDGVVRVTRMRITGMNRGPP